MTVIREVMTMEGGELVASSVILAVVKAAYQYILGVLVSLGTPKSR